MFKKILPIIIAILLSITISYADEEGLNKQDYLKLQIDNSISLDLNFENNYRIDKLSIESTFFPKTYEQSQFLNNFTTSHTNYRIIEELNRNSILYDLSEDAKTQNKIESTFIVESLVDRPQVSNVIEYPNENIDEEKYEPYLEFSGLITIDEDIRSQATELAQGKDDTYVIASEIAKWIREDINYDLSTITENPDQTSSEVFTSKAGVCKEITQLFVSMIRSLDIPARVVTGYSYTNSQEVIDFVGSPWGGHAWAEVLIDDKWVPFDLTYNQYGFVDATHIVTDKSNSIDETSVESNASGYGFSFVKNSLGIDNSFEVLEQRDKLFDRGFSIETNGPISLSSNSYGYINATITNDKNYYQVLFLNIAKTSEVELLTKNQEMLIFKPEETKTITINYKIPELDENYVYTLPFVLYNDFIEKNHTVTVKPDSKQLSEDDIPKREEKEASFSQRETELSCNGSFDIPKNTIICDVKNPNNYKIEGSSLCIKQQCREVDLLIGQTKQYSFQTNSFSPKAEFRYGDEIVSENISIEKPTLDVSSTLIGETLNIESSHNYNTSLRYNLLINNNSVEKKQGKSVTFSHQLETGNYSMKLQLENQETIYDTYTANVVVEKMNIFQKILAFFRNLF